MSVFFEEMMLWQLEKTAQEKEAAQNAGLYNADGSAEANDYRPPQLPTSTFPVLTAAPATELVVHRDQLRQVAAQMRSDLQRLQGALKRLEAEGDAGGTLHGWPTADALASNLRSAHESIRLLYDKLNTAYEAVIVNIHEAEANYARAESSTVTAVNRTGAGPAPAGVLAPGA